MRDDLALLLFVTTLLGLLAVAAALWAGPLAAAFAVPCSVAFGVAYGQHHPPAPAPAGRDDGGAE